MKNQNNLSLSVVIPAYNEEKIIAATIEEIQIYLKDNFSDAELIVVDDGSHDRTFEIINSISGFTALSNGRNKGKGYSVKNGIMHASKEYVLYIDADHSIPISYIEDFLQDVNHFDIVIGSKYLENTENYPLFRKIAGNIFSFLKKMITALPYKDTQCGFKLFKTTVAKEIFSHMLIDGWCFDVEALFIAKRLKIKVKERSVLLKKMDRVSRINIFGSGFKMLKDLFMIRLNSMSGKYNLKQK